MTRSWRRVTAEAVEPIVMTSGEQSRNRASTLPGITGSALRGALAAEALRRERLLRPPGRAESPPQEFLDVFETSMVRFPFLWPAGPPAPLTHSHCKADPGHAEADLLRAGPGVACPDCGSRLDRAEGTNPGARVRTRTAITDGGVAQAGMLYAQEELPEGGVYTGWLAVHDGAVDAFDRWVRPSEAHTLWVGADRSTGGKVRVRFGPARERPDGPSAAQRVAAWPAGELALTASSPLLLTDRWMRSLRRLEHHDLARLLGVADGVTVIPFTSVRTRPIAGWHGAAGLPKPTEFAIVPGSAIRVRLDRVDRVALVGRLEQLESAGVGLRRAEGFGQIVVCDPRHLDPRGACGRRAAQAAAPPPDDPEATLAQRLGGISPLRDLSLHHAERLYRAALQAPSVVAFDEVLAWAAGRRWAGEPVRALGTTWGKAKDEAADLAFADLDPGDLALAAIRRWLEDSVRAKRAKADR